MASENITNTTEEVKDINKYREIAWRREWKACDRVRHFEGNKYLIIGIGVDTETESEVIIYKRVDGTGPVWVRPRTMFEGKVDKEKYPDATQEWRFEKIE